LETDPRTGNVTGGNIDMADAQANSAINALNGSQFNG
jgi:hypothetical protein